MKAILQDRYGSTDVLQFQDVERPSIGDSEVLVRVHAASVNPPDWIGVSGVPYIVRAAFGLRRPKQPVRGTDLAGVVAAVGRKVTGRRAGDEVFGSASGTFAEYATASERHLALKPVNLTFEQAAAVPMSALTALHALRDVGHLRAGDKVLITGAGGGVGTFAVQLAKAAGAQVTAVCSAAKADLVRSLGAVRVIDYTTQDFTLGPERYDVILDNVLDHPLRRLCRVLRPGGTLVPNAGQFHKRWLASTGVMFVKAPLLGLVTRQRIHPAHESPNEADLLALKDLVESGKLTPVIGRSFPLELAAEALAVWGAGHSLGKTVITVQS
jgi:NADPH:quinone reductase-like Zn-dependent oxidoreductase